MSIPVLSSGSAPQPSFGQQKNSVVPKNTLLKDYLATPAGKLHKKELLSSLPVKQRARGLGINIAAITLGAALQNPAMVYSAGARQAVYGNGDLEWGKKQLLSKKDPHELSFDATRFTADSSSINALSFALLWEGALKAVRNSAFNGSKTRVYDALAIGSSLIVGPAVGSAFSRLYVIPTIQRKKAEDRVRKAAIAFIKSEPQQQKLQFALKERIAKPNAEKPVPFSKTPFAKSFTEEARTALLEQLKNDPKLNADYPYAERLKAALQKSPDSPETQKKIDALHQKMTNQALRLFVIPYLDRAERKEKMKADQSAEA